MDLATFTAELSTCFTITGSQLKAHAETFRHAMVEGLAGRPSSLKMLPSFIGKPTGAEKGAVLAIDFGGTNVRVLRADLDGKGACTIAAMKKFPLKETGKHDFTAADVPAAKLFGAIADGLKEVALPGQPQPLGYTFSFPCRQTAIASAELIHWTKEIRTAGVEGRDIGQLTDAALKASDLGNVQLKAIINDTVGTLLAAAYSHTNVDIASICGTGHNTCYLQPAHPLTGKPMIVNMESGNFDGVPQSPIDAALDAASERPGTQKLEKMLSGYYLGEIVRAVFNEMIRNNLLPASARLQSKQSVSGRDIDTILADTTADLAATRGVVTPLLDAGATIDLATLCAIKTLVGLIATRSARLVAATFAGTLLHTDPQLSRPHVIAIDGSLYEKMPGYDANIRAALAEIFGPKAAQLSTVLAKDGSGIGAAIAAGL